MQKEKACGYKQERKKEKNGQVSEVKLGEKSHLKKKKKEK
jgi:hypothetical protein